MKRLKWLVCLVALCTLCACATPVPTDQPTPGPPTPTPAPTASSARFPQVDVPVFTQLSLRAHAEKNGIVTDNIHPTAYDLPGDFYADPTAFMLRVRVTDKFVPVLGMQYGIMLKMAGQEPDVPDTWDRDKYSIPVSPEWQAELAENAGTGDAYTFCLGLTMQGTGADSYILREIEILDVYYAGVNLTLAPGNALDVREAAVFGPRDREHDPYSYFYDPSTLAEVFAPENCGVYGRFMESDADYVIVGTYASAIQVKGDVGNPAQMTNYYPQPTADTPMIPVVRGFFCVDEDLIEAELVRYNTHEYLPDSYYQVMDEDGFVRYTTLQERKDYWKQENAEVILRDYFAVHDKGYGSGDPRPTPRPTDDGE